MPSETVADAYRYCARLARRHYENFPVASLMIPRSRRPFLWSIYAFARTADDFADEGDIGPDERLRRLDEWQAKLDACVAGRPDGPVFIALADTLQHTGAPPSLLGDLLTAFRMDVRIHRYETYSDLLGYCRYSANPVGRLVLHVFKEATSANLSDSDHICTALQLTNFWQDVEVDAGKGRVYLPLEDCRRFGYNAGDTSGKGDALRDLLRFEVARTRALFREGRPLLSRAGKPLRLELAVTWHGGMRILEKIEEHDYAVIGRRPSLGIGDLPRLIMHALRERKS